jgi:hypothetical protein
MSGALSYVALKEPTYALDHNDAARGLNVRIQVDMGGEIGTLIIKYDPDPILLKRPWNTSPASERRNNYA